MSKILFYEIFTTCYVLIGPKITNAQSLLKFGIFDMSNIPILIFMSEIFFVKYEASIRPKLVPKVKFLEIY